jgi:hypothetical protein
MVTQLRIDVGENSRSLHSGGQKPPASGRDDNQNILRAQSAELTA